MMKFSFKSALSRIMGEGSSDTVGGGSQDTDALDSISLGYAGVRTLVEAFPLPVVIMRALDGVVLDTNCHTEKHCDRYGFLVTNPGAAPEVIGGDLDASLARALRDRCSHAEIGADDRQFFARISSHPIDFGGEDASLIVIDDVSSAKEVETELRRSLNQLGKAQQIARLGYWEFDIASQRSTWSPELLDIFGISDGEALSLDRSLGLSFVHPEDRNKIERAFQDAVGGAETYDLDFRITRADGEKRIVRSWSGVRVEDEQGQVSAVITAFQDLTQDLQALEPLQGAHKMEVLGELTGGVAHNFNNLLAVIKGNLELIYEDEIGEPHHRRMLASAICAAQRGASLTTRLLGYSRNQSLEPRCTRLSDICFNLNSVLRSSLDGRIEIECVAERDIWPVVVDPEQLEACLASLATNAFDAMPEGGVLSITARNATSDSISTELGEAVQPGDYVVIEVADNGIGMSEDVRQKIFDPFFSTKTAQRASGLGLSMVYGFFKQSNGHVRVASELDVGTTVYLYLPKFRGDAPLRETETGHRSDKVSARGGMVVVVEDDPSVRSVAVQMVERMGHTVVDVENAEAALRLIETTGEVDLILSDVILGTGMTGLELAREIERRNPATSVVLMSGYTRNALKDKADEMLDFVLLQKPFDVAALERAFSTVFQEKGV